MPISKCKNCEKEFKGRSGQQFCCRGCATSHRQKANDPDFLSDESLTDEFKGYVVGLIFSDGCLSQQENKLERITIALKDADMIEELRQIITPSRKLYINKAREEQHSNSYALITTNESAIHQLKEWGLTQRKSTSVQHPFGIPYEYKYFVKGYFDGNGSIFENHVNGRTYKYISITTGSREFAEGMRIKLEQYRFNFSIVEDSRHQAYYLRLYKQKEIKRFRDWMYENSEWHLDRKRNLFDDIV